jgi:sugar phosphate isomerase/epimerase
MSIVNFMAFPETGSGEGDIASSLVRIAEDDFFDAVELAWIKDPAQRRQVKQILECSQLQVCGCAHPTILSQKLSLNHLDPVQRAEAIGQMKVLIEQAAEIGARRFALLSGPDPGHALREQAVAVLIDSLRQLCDFARPRGVALTLETFDRDIDKKALIGPVRDAARVAEAVRTHCPDFGLLYDLSHMPILNETSGDMTVIKDYLVHVHVGNCVLEQGHPCYGDKHPSFGLPGSVNGAAELSEFIRGLFAVGYLAEGKQPKPWVGFEVKPQMPCDTPGLIIANAKRAWRQAWSVA